MMEEIYTVHILTLPVVHTCTAQHRVELINCAVCSVPSPSPGSAANIHLDDETAHLLYQYTLTATHARIYV